MQVFPTYINHSPPLIPDGIYLIIERALRGERSQMFPYRLSAEQGSIWYHFYNVLGMTRSGIEPTTSLLRGERFNHWATAALYHMAMGRVSYMWICALTQHYECEGQQKTFSNFLLSCCLNVNYGTPAFCRVSCARVYCTYQRVQLYI